MRCDEVGARRVQNALTLYTGVPCIEGLARLPEAFGWKSKRFSDGSVETYARTSIGSDLTSRYESDCLTPNLGASPSQPASAHVRSRSGVHSGALSLLSPIPPPQQEVKRLASVGLPCLGRQDAQEKGRSRGENISNDVGRHQLGFRAREQLNAKRGLASERQQVVSARQPRNPMTCRGPRRRYRDESESRSSSLPYFREESVTRKYHRNAAKCIVPQVIPPSAVILCRKATRNS